MANREDLLAVAYITATHGLKQKEIAGILGIGPVMVTRLLKEAKEANILQSRLKLTDNQQKELKEKLHSLLDPQVLDCRRVLLKNHPELRTVRVVDSDTTKPRTHTERVTFFGQAIGREIRNHCIKSKVVGIAWGRSVAATISAIAENYSKATPRRNPIKFVPILGDPVGVNAPAGDSASRLARELHVAINGGTQGPPSLTGIAAVIPAKYTGQEMATIKAFLEECKASALGNLFDQVDCIISGFSPHQNPWYTEDDTFCKTAGLNRKELNSVALGELAGVLIEQPDLTEEERETFNSYTERWMGFSRDNLVKCARDAARDPRRTGVVALGVGADKAPVAYHLIQEGLINHLYVDHILMKKLWDIM